MSAYAASIATKAVSLEMQRKLKGNRYPLRNEKFDPKFVLKARRNSLPNHLKYGIFGNAKVSRKPCGFFDFDPVTGTWRDMSHIAQQYRATHTNPNLGLGQSHLFDYRDLLFSDPGEAKESDEKNLKRANSLDDLHLRTSTATGSSASAAATTEGEEHDLDLSRIWSENDIHSADVRSIFRQPQNLEEAREIWFRSLNSFASSPTVEREERHGNNTPDAHDSQVWNLDDPVDLLPGANTLAGNVQTPAVSVETTTSEDQHAESARMWPLEIASDIAQFNPNEPAQFERDVDLQDSPVISSAEEQQQDSDNASGMWPFEAQGEPTAFNPDSVAPNDLIQGAQEGDNAAMWPLEQADNVSDFVVERDNLLVSDSAGATMWPLEQASELLDFDAERDNLNPSVSNTADATMWPLEQATELLDFDAERDNLDRTDDAVMWPLEQPTELQDFNVATDNLLTNQAVESTTTAAAIPVAPNKVQEIISDFESKLSKKRSTCSSGSSDIAEEKRPATFILPEHKADDSEVSIQPLNSDSTESILDRFVDRDSLDHPQIPNMMRMMLSGNHSDNEEFEHTGYDDQTQEDLFEHQNEESAVPTLVEPVGIADSSPLSVLSNTSNLTQEQEAAEEADVEGHVASDSENVSSDSDEAIEITDVYNSNADNEPVSDNLNADGISGGADHGVIETLYDVLSLNEVVDNEDQRAEDVDGDVVSGDSVAAFADFDDINSQSAQSVSVNTAHPLSLIDPSTLSASNTSGSLVSASASHLTSFALSSTSNSSTSPSSSNLSDFSDFTRESNANDELQDCDVQKSKSTGKMKTGGSNSKKSAHLKRRAVFGKAAFKDFSDVSSSSSSSSSDSDSSSNSSDTSSSSCYSSSSTKSFKSSTSSTSSISSDPSSSSSSSDTDSSSVSSSSCLSSSSSSSSSSSYSANLLKASRKSKPVALRYPAASANKKNILASIDDKLTSKINVVENGGKVVLQNGSESLDESSKFLITIAIVSSLLVLFLLFLKKFSFNSTNN